MELVKDKNVKYPKELGFSDDTIYKANLGEVINKLKDKIEELELRIKKLEKK